MCGGIVGTFSLIIPKSHTHLPYLIAYNFGRIFSYCVAGGITGYIGSITTLSFARGGQALQLISALFLLMMGLYLANWWRGLTHLERLGHHLWKRIQPLSKKFIPFKSPVNAIPYGMLWGWLPCGLVYSALTWSLASGGMIEGVQVMFFFGLGTLPALISLGGSQKLIKDILTNSYLKQIIALTLIAFALILFMSVFLSHR
jgi:sulfite exporter TauE/SafE